MMERLLLIKYGEIHLKGLNRPFFKRLLRQRLLENMQDLHCRVQELHGRVFVTGFAPADEPLVIERCIKTFGVVGVSPAAKVEKTLEAIGQAAIAELQAAMQRDGQTQCTFKVKARREDKTFSPNSDGINREIGGMILQALPQTRVDVHRPDHLIQVEVRDGAYVYAQSIQAAGGMPVGSSGKAMLMLSGGIDSPVAGWMMAKRGMTISAVHFLSPPYTGEPAKQKVLDLASEMACYCGPIRLHLVRFTELQEELYEKGRHEYLTVLMRRSMMQIAQRLAEEEGAKALITGESLGQVASQTIDAIRATNAVADMPVFRPLIGMDKTEIIEMARRIGTFETSIRPGEDCCTVFVPKHPATHPILEKIAAEEAKIDLPRLIEQALERTEHMIIQPHQ